MELINCHIWKQKRERVMLILENTVKEILVNQVNKEHYDQ
jgi:hypothetical protein